MTKRQKIFIAEYIKDFNGRRAAIEAGYSEKTASEMAYENLRKPQIAAEIQKHIDIVVGDKRKILTENIKRLESIADNELEKSADRIKATELLGKYIEMFTDKQQIEHTTIDSNGDSTGINFG